MKRASMGLTASAAMLLGMIGTLPATGHAFAAGKTGPQVKPQRELLLGSLTILNSTSASILSPGGTTTNLTVGAYTRFVAHTQAAATAGVKSGDQVAVDARMDSRGTRAVRVEYDTVPFGVKLHVNGTITSGTPTSLVITTKDGSTVTVQLDGKTRLNVEGAKVTSLAMVPTNEQADVVALQMTSGGTVATRVDIRQAPPKGQRVHVAGTGPSISGTTLSVTVKKNAAPVQVQLSASTRYIVGGKLVSSAPAFTSNQRVEILATRQADGSLAAYLVIVR